MRHFSTPRFWIKDRSEVRDPETQPMNTWRPRLMVTVECEDPVSGRIITYEAEVALLHERRKA